MSVFDVSIDVARQTAPARMAPAEAVARIHAAEVLVRTGERARPGRVPGAWAAALRVRSRRATTAVEYALITAMVAVVIMMSLDMLDAKLRHVYASITGAL
jgi:Flp pilus assembly pilin Flp